MVSRPARTRRPKAPTGSLRDLFRTHLEGNRAQWFKRGSPAWLVDRVYPPSRIAALLDGKPVAVHGWEFKTVLPGEYQNAIDSGHLYMLDDRLYPMQCSNHGCTVCGGPDVKPSGDAINDEISDWVHGEPAPKDAEAVDRPETTGVEIPEHWRPPESKPVALSTHGNCEEAEVWMHGGRLDD